ncbi:MAG: fibronectin type III domain-containing protein [Erysipelotrichaceae bacterium]|nr:fibronectin type III domain-containing protein [Erysipelotrichaceae bacterium]
MPAVTNLKIQLQSGTTNTYFASWDFNDTYRSTTTQTVTAPSSIKVGNWVTVKSGAKAFNGVSLAPLVFNNGPWEVIQIGGQGLPNTRVVIHRNKSGTNAIMTPIHINNLVGENQSSSSTQTVVAYNTLEHYIVEWSYYTGDGVWFTAQSSNIKNKYATYSPPANALRFRVSVKPVSKTHKVNGVDTVYWTGTTLTKVFEMAYAPPQKPSSAPSVKIEKYTLEASLNNITDIRADKIEFQIFNGTKILKTINAKVEMAQAACSFGISPGGSYRVRCRAVNIVGSSKVYGEWSAYSNALSAEPPALKGIANLRANSPTEIYIAWQGVVSAKNYTIQYTTNKDHFDGSSDVTKIDTELLFYTIGNLETGKEYFFRVRANNSTGSSPWTKVKSIIIGRKPAAPTTWMTTITAITGESITLYWLHNAQDNSIIKSAIVEVYMGKEKHDYLHTYNRNEDSADTVCTRLIDTSKCSEGLEIKWRVKTAGVTGEYGDWSIQRMITVYAPPTLEFTLTDTNDELIETLTSFPFRFHALAGPHTQAPTGYHLSIVSLSMYETVDQVGNPKIVNEGEEVFSKYYDIGTFDDGKNFPLLTELYPNHIDLTSNVRYKAICVASMDSGLTVESFLEFDVLWTELKYEPDAEIGIDYDTYSAYIRPYCIDYDDHIIDEVTLSVYRREFDDRFTEIATDIDSYASTTVIDPHPSLDYARYRIVATAKDTGAVSFYDPPGYPVKCSDIVLQWNEEWCDFDAHGEQMLDAPSWTGSLLKLPYNIDISENNSIDVELVKYIGRAHPVSYYGTQLGTGSSWNTVIPKGDKETLYALRRLAIWMGDVYVREPSGIGYWANISVSFSQKHCDSSIPVSIDITRVEGSV